MTSPAAPLPRVPAFRPLRLGPLAVPSNLALAPLAGWTTRAFRLLVRSLGGVGMATTEVVAAKALIGRNRNTDEYLLRDPADRPLAAQVSCSSEDEARDAARILEGLGFDAVDMNLGCPVRKIATKGGGAGLARDACEAAAVIHAAVRAVKIPVTAKMRLGWGPGDLSAPGLARALVEAGVAAIAIHGRTRSQGFSGAVDLEGIRAVVEAVGGRVPVLGNGDVTSADGARRMLASTGADGVLIGRAAVTNPWIFAEARALLEAGEAPPPAPLEARLEACLRHFRLLARDVTEVVAARRFRKILRAWGLALRRGDAFRERASRIAGEADLRALLEDVRRDALPEEDATGAASVVAVPAGPTDLW